MQLIHYCGFAFAIIFAICNHSAQKAERIMHVCQKVLEFSKSAKIVLSKNGQMDWQKVKCSEKLSNFQSQMSMKYSINLSS